MIIKVTQKHINEGIREDSCMCPVALAIKDRLAGRCSVSAVDVEEHYIFTGSAHCAAPRSVKRFINRFDKNGRNSVKPFNFKLNINIWNDKNV